MIKRPSIVVWSLVLISVILSFTGCGSGEDEHNMNSVQISADQEAKDEGTEGDLQQNTDESVAVDEKSEEGIAEGISVYVCGAVVEPDVYELEEGDRIIDAIEIAGGMTEEASPTYLNQAEPLVDGQRVYVPTNEEVEESSTNLISSESQSQESQKTNLNTATKEELMTLPGIGESKADAIIKYREEQGGFESIEDIQNISGIKSGVFDNIKEHIIV